jgi:hypothetical protein
VKKAILIVAALMLVISGVAAVSAYEAHVVNVKAKVENALEVVIPGATELDFGTVFPEEWLTKHFTVQFSSSWGEQTRVNAVDFQVWAECKLEDDMGNEDPADDVYYPWLGEALYVKLNGDEGYVGPAPAACPGAVQVMDYVANAPLVGTLQTNVMNSLQVNVWLDVPVFFDYYNEYTDVPNKPREAWADEQLAAFLGKPIAEVVGIPSLVLPTGLGPHGYWMGVDLKIQVSNIYVK